MSNYYYDMADTKTFIFSDDRDGYGSLKSVEVKKGERMTQKRKLEIAKEVGATWITCVQGWVKREKFMDKYSCAGNRFTTYALINGKFQMTESTNRNN